MGGGATREWVPAVEVGVGVGVGVRGVGVGVGVVVVEEMGVADAGLVGMEVLLVVEYTGMDSAGGPSNRGLFTRRLAVTAPVPVAPAVPIVPVEVEVEVETGVEAVRTRPVPLAPALRSGMAWAGWLRRE